MSERSTTKDQKVLSAPNRPPPRTFGGGPFGGGGLTEKPMSFGPSVRAPRQRAASISRAVESGPPDTAASTRSPG